MCVVDLCTVFCHPQYPFTNISMLLTTATILAVVMQSGKTKETSATNVSVITEHTSLVVKEWL